MRTLAEFMGLSAAHLLDPFILFISMLVGFMCRRYAWALGGALIIGSISYLLAGMAQQSGLPPPIILAAAVTAAIVAATIGHLLSRAIRLLDGSASPSSPAITSLEGEHVEEPAKQLRVPPDAAAK